MSRTLADLPRDWLMEDLAMIRADRMKELVAEAVIWGFDEPDDLTNQNKRMKWLRSCREKAWDLLTTGADAPPPGKPQPADAKPRRAPRRPRPAPKMERDFYTPRHSQPDDVFPPSGNGRRTKKAPRKPVRADLAKGFSAAEANEWLRSLPDPEDS